MDKEAFIKEKGWSQWYNPNYWVHMQFGSPSVDHTTRGMSLDEAYAFETDPESREKTLKGMALYFGALKALSNLGHNASNKSGGSDNG